MQAEPERFALLRKWRKCFPLSCSKSIFWKMQGLYWRGWQSRAVPGPEGLLWQWQSQGVLQNKPAAFCIREKEVELQWLQWRNQGQRCFQIAFHPDFGQRILQGSLKTWICDLFCYDTSKIYHPLRNYWHHKSRRKNAEWMTQTLQSVLWLGSVPHLEVTAPTWWHRIPSPAAKQSEIISEQHFQTPESHIRITHYTRMQQKTRAFLNCLSLHSALPVSAGLLLERGVTHF